LHKWKCRINIFYYLFWMCLCIIHIAINNSFHLTKIGKTGPAAIYIHTEELSKVVTNIFAANYFRWYSTVKTNVLASVRTHSNVLGLGIIFFPGIFKDTCRMVRPMTRFLARNVFIRNVNIFSTLPHSSI
jgi:hypothetical protein